MTFEHFVSYSSPAVTRNLSPLSLLTCLFKPALYHLHKTDVFPLIRCTYHTYISSLDLEWLVAQYLLGTLYPFRIASIVYFIDASYRLHVGREREVVEVPVRLWAVRHVKER